ncbi:MAG: zinc ribbon domain-containing protein [Candidatus Sigynarchaeota archaeon]
MGFVARGSGRAGKILLVASVVIAGLAMMLVANARKPALRVGGRFPEWIVASQYPVNADITIVNYSGPSFTWSEPITFNFAVDSNISAVLTVIAVSDAVYNFTHNMNVNAGLNSLTITLGINPLAAPGSHRVNFTFGQAGNTTMIVHEIVIGSNPFISYGILFGALGFTIAIYAAVGAPKKPKASSSGPFGSAAGAADDDTSTVTYVDQSQAPPGRIFCPECKKVIEEGSIFCPECGTRIPRYLRYHP